MERLQCQTSADICLEQDCLSNSSDQQDVVRLRRTISLPIHSSYLLFIVIAVVLIGLVSYADAQALNDPITQYIEGRLGNRRIFWCPSGYGYLAYCPQPTDWDNYNWLVLYVALYGLLEAILLSFALPTGAVVAIIIASIILVAVLIGLSCWCCYCCPLYKQLYEYEDDEITPPPGREGGRMGGDR